MLSFPLELLVANLPPLQPSPLNHQLRSSVVAIQACTTNCLIAELPAVAIPRPVASNSTRISAREFLIAAIFGPPSNRVKQYREPFIPFHRYPSLLF